MEERMEKLRSYLIERLDIINEIKVLSPKEFEITCPSEYLECVGRLETIRNRLYCIEFDIQQLTTLLQSKLGKTTSSVEEAMSGDQSPSMIELVGRESNGLVYLSRSNEG